MAPRGYNSGGEGGYSSTATRDLFWGKILSTDPLCQPSLKLLPPRLSPFSQDKLPEVTMEFIRDEFPFHKTFHDLPDLFDWSRPVEDLWYTVEVRFPSQALANQPPLRFGVVLTVVSPGSR